MQIAYPECGKVVNTHGCRGEVKIESYCDSEDVLASLKTVYTKKNGAYIPHRVLFARVHKGAVIARIEGVSDMYAAEKMKNTVLYAARQDVVSDGGFLLVDLIGLPLVDAESGRAYGTVTEVTRGVASDLYTVKTKKGDVLFPAVSEFVKEIRDDAILVTPVSGLFDEI